MLGRFRLCKLLLVSRASACGNTPALILAAQGMSTVKETETQPVKSKTLTRRRDLRAAIIGGKVDQVKKILESDADVNANAKLDISRLRKLGEVFEETKKTSVE